MTILETKDIEPTPNPTIQTIDIIAAATDPLNATTIHMAGTTGATCDIFKTGGMNRTIDNACLAKLMAS